MQKKTETVWLTVEAGLETDATLDDVGHADLVHIPRLGGERTSGHVLTEVGHLYSILT